LPITKSALVFEWSVFVIELKNMLFPSLEHCSCYQHVCLQWPGVKKSLKHTPLFRLTEQSFCPTREQWDDVIRSHNLKELFARQELCDRLIDGGWRSWTEVQQAVGPNSDKQPLKTLMDQVKGVFVVDEGGDQDKVKPEVIGSLVAQWLTEVSKALPFAVVHAEAEPPLVEVFENETLVLELGGPDASSWSHSSCEWVQIMKDAVHTTPAAKRPYRLKSGGSLVSASEDELVKEFDRCHQHVVWLGRVTSMDLATKVLENPDVKFLAFECGHYNTIVPRNSALTQLEQSLRQWNASQQEIIDIVTPFRPSTSHTSGLLSDLARQGIRFQLEQDTPLGFSVIESVDGSVNMPWTAPKMFRDRMFDGKSKRGFVVLADASEAWRWKNVPQLKLADESSLMRVLHTKHDALLTCVNEVGYFPKTTHVQPLFGQTHAVIAPPNSALRVKAMEKSPESVIMSKGGVLWEKTSFTHESDIWSNPTSAWIQWTIDSAGNSRVPFNRFVSGAFGRPMINHQTLAYQIVMSPETMSNSFKALHKIKGFRCVLPLNDETSFVEQDVEPEYEIVKWSQDRSETTASHVILSSRFLVPVSGCDDLVEGEWVLLRKKTDGVVEQEVVMDTKWPWVYSFGKMAFPRFKPALYLAAFAPVKWFKVEDSSEFSQMSECLRAETRLKTLIERKTPFGQTTQFIWDAKRILPDRAWQQLRVCNGLGVCPSSQVSCMKDVELCGQLKPCCHRISQWVPLDVEDAVHSGNWRQIVEKGLQKQKSVESGCVTVALALHDANEQSVVCFLPQGLVSSENGHVVATVSREKDWEQGRPEGTFPMDNGVLLDVRHHSADGDVGVKMNGGGLNVNVGSFLDEQSVSHVFEMRGHAGTLTAAPAVFVPFLSTILASEIISSQ
jgi:hypothetical protein